MIVSSTKKALNVKHKSFKKIRVSLSSRRYEIYSEYPKRKFTTLSFRRYRKLCFLISFFIFTRVIQGSVGAYAFYVILNDNITWLFYGILADNSKEFIDLFFISTKNVHH